MILSTLFGFALTAAYIPGISGAATTPRWDVAALLGVALLFVPRVRMTKPHSIGLALIGWLATTLIWSGGQLDGVDAIFKILLALIAFAVGSTMIEIDSIFLGAALGLAISSGVAIAQFCGWQGLPTFGGGYAGLFYNQGRLGAAAPMVILWLAPWPKRWTLLPLLIPALVLSGSRAAWLAVVAGLLALPGSQIIYLIRYAVAISAAAVFTTISRSIPSTRSTCLDMASDPFMRHSPATPISSTSPRSERGRSTRTTNGFGSLMRVACRRSAWHHGWPFRSGALVPKRRTAAFWPDYSCSRSAPCPSTIRSLSSWDHCLRAGLLVTVLVFATLLSMAEYRYARGWPPRDVRASVGQLERAKRAYPFDPRFREGPEQRIRIYLLKGI
jgi:hypothetical protein